MADSQTAGVGMKLELTGDWLVDNYRPGEMILQRVSERLHTASTEYQRAELVNIVGYGRALVLDGSIQLAQADEAIYHEVLVHPALLALEQPRRVAILGGGDGAALREVLRHRAVERVVLVDLDAQVVDFCRRWLADICQDAFDDKRLQLVYADARRWVAEQPDASYDVVISDVTEPHAGGPAAMLFTREFYQLVHRILAPTGILVVQSGPANPLDHELFCRIQATVAEVFSRSRVLLSFVASFADQWGFVLGLKGDCRLPEPERVDDLLAARVDGQLFHYDGECHRHATSLPLYLRRALQRPHIPFTDAVPPGLRPGQDLPGSTSERKPAADPS